MATANKVSKNAGEVARYADMFSAMGTESRLRIMQLLLSAHPEGLVVSEIQDELEIPNSTLSHHLDKLKNEELVPGRSVGYISALHGQYRSAARNSAIFIFRVLHPKQGSQTARFRPIL